jgi:hypothetical protein
MASTTTSSPGGDQAGQELAQARAGLPTVGEHQRTAGQNGAKTSR